MSSSTNDLTSIDLCDVELTRQGDYYHYGKRSLLAGKGRSVNWKRGKITKFSRNSRKRMMRFLAKVRWDGALFVTLTSRNDVTYAQLTALMKRYYRKWGKTPAIWRKEEQSRGVYHYHILIFTRNWLPVQWLIKSWEEVIGESGSVSVKYVSNRSKTWRYITKYMSKIGSDEENDVAGGAERERSDAGDSILDNTIISRRVVGRFWGYFNKHLFRFAEVHHVKLLECSSKVIESYLYIVQYLKRQDWGAVVTGFSFVVI